MPIKTSTLAALDTKTMRIDFGDAGDLNIEYRPNGITLDLLAKLRNAEDEETVVGLFFSVITSWDLQGDDGKTLPVDRSSYGFFSVPLIRTIIERMQAAELPNAETSNA